MATNTEPIYTVQPIDCTKKLTTQTAPRSISTETPVLAFTSGTSGALINAITIRPLGDNVATVLRVYKKSATGDDTAYHLILEHSLTATSGASNTAKLDFSTQTDDTMILPLRQAFDGTVRGINIAPNVSIYLALGTSIANGLEVTVWGGYYEKP